MVASGWEDMDPPECTARQNMTTHTVNCKQTGLETPSIFDCIAHNVEKHYTHMIDWLVGIVFGKI